MDRLRNRDLRTNNNKCYTMYFDDDQNKDITNKNSMPAKKGKTRSPRKKEPVKNCTATTNQLTNDIAAAMLTETIPSSNKMQPQTIQASRDIKNNDAIAVNEKHLAELNDSNNEKNEKPLDFSGANESKGNELSKLSKCMGNDINRNNENSEALKDIQCMNNNGAGTSVGETTNEHINAICGKQMLNFDYKKIDVLTESISNGENDNGNTERKRRLSQLHMERNEDIVDDEDDVDINESNNLVYSGKKAKIEFSKTKMFQV